MTQFVRQQRGQFVLTAKQACDLPGNVDPPAGQDEGIGEGAVVENDLWVYAAARGDACEQPVQYRFRIGGNRVSGK